MSETVTFAVITFLSLLPMVDPFGNMPIFAALTEGLPAQGVRRVAIKANMVACFGILFIGFFGQTIFETFGITLDGLRVVGGVIFFIMGYDMLQARISRTKVSSPMTATDIEKLNEMAVTPLGIPLLCGPGAMTNGMLLMSDAGTVDLKIGFVVGAVAITTVSGIALLSAAPVAKFIGPNGSKVILRLMGLILMVMAVESFFAGITPMVRAMLVPAV